MTPRLKLANPMHAVPLPVEGAPGGLGLDFETVPAHLGEVGRAAWLHVASVLTVDPVYLRELDRHALTAYCEALELREAARRQLMSDGVIVDGRSSQDRGRSVRHPSFQIWRDCDARVERWSVQLGLTRLGRHRLGQVIDREDDATNPFAAPTSDA
jgi:P27 family predicted phage terminase small subunit